MPEQQYRRNAGAEAAAATRWRGTRRSCRARWRSHPAGHGPNVGVELVTVMAVTAATVAAERGRESVTPDLAAGDRCIPMGHRCSSTPFGGNMVLVIIMATTVTTC